VVGDTCGVQTQVAVMSRIALRARIRDLTEDGIERALYQKRSLVKTWSLRGALHLHRSKDLPVILRGLMASRLHHHDRWIRRLGLREESTTRMVLAALEDGPLTRSEFVERLAVKLGPRSKSWRDGGWGVQKAGSSLLYHLVRPAMTRGLVCFGPDRGREVTYVRTDQWLRSEARMPEEVAAEDTLVRRYLHSFGPADPEDFWMWSGSGLRRVRDTFGRLADEVVEVDADGRRAVLLKKDLAELESVEIDHGSVRLLPSFDPFLLGHRHRQPLVDEAHYRLVYKEAGWLAPVVLLDGRVAGTWSYRRQARTLEVDVKPFTTFDKETRTEIEEHALDLSRFLEIPGVAVRFSNRSG
jgi:hypothetical protein